MIRKKKVSENISIYDDWRIHNNSHDWKSTMNWLKTKNNKTIDLIMLNVILKVDVHIENEMTMKKM
jgi:propanediol dehydratase small subunit